MLVDFFLCLYFEITLALSASFHTQQTTPNGTDVIVMELCPHGSLYNVLDSPENSSGLCEEEFLLVLKQISKGYLMLKTSLHRQLNNVC